MRKLISKYVHQSHREIAITDVWQNQLYWRLREFEHGRRIQCVIVGRGHGTQRMVGQFTRVEFSIEERLITCIRGASTNSLRAEHPAFGFALARQILYRSNKFIRAEGV